MREATVSGGAAADVDGVADSVGAATGAGGETKEPGVAMLLFTESTRELGVGII